MIVILKQNANKAQLTQLENWIRERGLDIHECEGVNCTILGLIGDTSKIDIDLLGALEIVENVKRVSEPYKNANRKFHPLDTVVDVCGVKIGGGNFAVFAVSYRWRYADRFIPGKSGFEIQGKSGNVFDFVHCSAGDERCCFFVAVFYEFCTKGVG